MKKPSRRRILAYTFLLGNAVVWGLAFPIVKRGFQDGLTPTAFLLGRFLGAALISLPIILFILKKPSVKKTLTPRNLIKIFLLEMLGTFLALLLLYEGLARTTAIEASLIAVTWPVFVVIGGVLFLREREQKHELVGLSIAVFGSLLLIINPLFIQGVRGSIIGNLLIVGQNVTIAAYYLLAKKYYRGLNKWAVTHVGFWVGIVSFTAFTLFVSRSPIDAIISLFVAPTLWPLIATIYMAVFGSIIGLTLYLLGQERIEASEAGMFTYIQPAFAIPAAFLLLGETISLIEIIAITIIIFGVVIAARRT